MSSKDGMPRRWKITIHHEGDWNDELPQFVRDGVPINFTGWIIEIYVRAWYNGTLIKKLSTATSDILVQSVTTGLAKIFVPRATLIQAPPTGIPVSQRADGQDFGWDCFMVGSEPDGSGGFYRWAMARGPLYVKAGLTP